MIYLLGNVFHGGWWRQIWASVGVWLFGRGHREWDILLSLNGQSRLNTQQEGTPNEAVLTPLVAVVCQVSMLYSSSVHLSLVQDFSRVSVITVGSQGKGLCPSHRTMNKEGSS